MSRRPTPRDWGHPRYVARRGTLAIPAALALAGPAAAQEPLPEDNAGGNQYVEPVPDAGGDRPAAPRAGGGGASSGGGGASSGGGGDSLSARTRRALGLVSRRRVRRR